MDGDRVRQREEQWDQERDPRRLLDLYAFALEATRPGPPSTVTARKWRLAAVACCRTLWPLLEEDEEARRAVEVVEAAADGEADDLDLHEAGEVLRRSRVEEQGMCWYDEPYIAQASSACIG